MELFDQIWHAIWTGTLPDLGVWSYLILFVLVMVEGPAVTLLAGAMAGAGILRFDVVFALALVANTLADTLWYSLGFFGGNRALLYRYRWMRRRRTLIKRLEHEMHQRAVRLFLLSKMSAGMMTIPLLIAAGVARVPWYRLLLVSIFFEPIWNGLLLFGGYRLGDYLAQLDRGLQIMAIVGTTLMLVVSLTIYQRIFQRVTHIADPPG